MSRISLYRQITGILEANSMTWTETFSGGIYLRFSSAGVSIEITHWGSQTLIEISSQVLTEVESEVDHVLREVNRLNGESHFSRWVFYAESRTIAVEYDLLGDHLQENELMTALAALARAADYHDDHLQKLIGGRRAFEV